MSDKLHSRMSYSAGSQGFNVNKSSIFAQLGIFIIYLMLPWWLLVAQTVKRLPGMWETWVRFLGRDDPLEKEMAAHSSILAWKIPWTGEPGGLQSMGSQRVGHD